MLHRTGLIILLITLSASCDDDQKKQENKCTTSQRCYWNPETNMYDRNCEYLVSDGGAPCPADAGSSDQTVSSGQ